MGTAYTPGLTVNADHVTTKRRQLPLAGEVLVEEGQLVRHDTPVARAELPGDIETIRLADRMQLDTEELEGKVRVSIGDSVSRGQLLAESPGLFGWFRSEVLSPIGGTVEFYSGATGHLGIRRPPTHVEVRAYVSGRVVDVVAKEAVLVRTRGAFIQGIFGVGGERHGEIAIGVAAPDETMDPDRLDEGVRGKVLVAGAHTDHAALTRAASLGAAAVVAGGIDDADLRAFLGYDIGIAVTGDEDTPLTVIVTEGFGRIPMARRTFELLTSLQGRFAAVNGATQIRAGAIRPEIIVPHAGVGDQPLGEEAGRVRLDSQQLVIGTPVRAVRHPYFGAIGSVSALPPEPVRIPSGASVRVLAMRLADGTEVTLPRSNVEIIEER